MSDAFTDIARDDARSVNYERYLQKIKDYLSEPSDDNRKKVFEAAKETDSIRGGWSGRTNLQEFTPNLIEGLLMKNKELWAKFLFALSDKENIKAFKALSPFAGKLLVGVDYGIGFVTFRGELESFVESILQSRTLNTYNGNKYFLALDAPSLDVIEVIQTDS